MSAARARARWITSHLLSSSIRFRRHSSRATYASGRDSTNPTMTARAVSRMGLWNRVFGAGDGSGSGISWTDSCRFILPDSSFGCVSLASSSLPYSGFPRSLQAIAVSAAAGFVSGSRADPLPALLRFPLSSSARFSGSIRFQGFPALSCDFLAFENLSHISATVLCVNTPTSSRFPACVMPASRKLKASISAHRVLSFSLRHAVPSSSAVNRCSRLRRQRWRYPSPASFRLDAISGPMRLTLLPACIERHASD